ncbi:chemotaxis protein CheB [soil metagenome]
MNTMTDAPRAVVIGASAGAVEVLSSILPNLSKSTPFPVFVVVHLPPHGESAISQLFKEMCEMRVKEAEDKETIESGVIYFAAPDYHMLVEPNLYLSLSNEEPVRYSRPSIDVLFESAADVYKERLVGIILSGANSDGAMGLREVSNRGGTCFVQDPREALCTAMPVAALTACPQAHAASVREISAFLRSWGEGNNV